MRLNMKYLGEDSELAIFLKTKKDVKNFDNIFFKKLYEVFKVPEVFEIDNNVVVNIANFFDYAEYTGNNKDVKDFFEDNKIKDLFISACDEVYCLCEQRVLAGSCKFDFEKGTYGTQIDDVDYWQDRYDNDRYDYERDMAMEG